MRLLYGHDEAVARFVADRLEDDPVAIFGNCRAIGVIDEGGLLVAGVVYHNWWPDAQTIELSSAASTPKWLTRANLSRIYGYAFDVAGAQMIVARTSAVNSRVHKLLSRSGFEGITIPRLYGRNEDGVLWTLTEEAYRNGLFHDTGVQKAEGSQAACAY